MKRRFSSRALILLIVGVFSLLAVGTVLAQSGASNPNSHEWTPAQDRTPVDFQDFPKLIALLDHNGDVSGYVSKDELWFGQDDITPEEALRQGGVVDYELTVRDESGRPIRKQKSIRPDHVSDSAREGDKTK